MKNLIDPKLLVKFQEQPVPLEEIVQFIDTHDDISTNNLCKLIGIEASKVYSYRGSLKRKEVNQL